jgi:hypothetical protein
MTGTKVFLSAAIIGAGLMLVSASGMATVSTSVNSMASTASVQDTMVQKAGYLNRCRWGIGGYHKWVQGVGRVQCTARKCWRNSWGIRRCRWY